MVSWQKASGLLGQIINVFRVLLFVAVGIIFIAAMLIMYLSVLMATLQRTQMFGTMRAIGAQRGMILSMVLIESLVLGLIFGGLGMLAGSGVLAAIATPGHRRAQRRDVLLLLGAPADPSADHLAAGGGAGDHPGGDHRLDAAARR